MGRLHRINWAEMCLIGLSKITTKLSSAFYESTRHESKSGEYENKLQNEKMCLKVLSGKATREGGV